MMFRFPRRTPSSCTCKEKREQWNTGHLRCPEHTFTFRVGRDTWRAYEKKQVESYPWTTNLESIDENGSPVRWQSFYVRRNA